MTTGKTADGSYWRVIHLSLYAQHFAHQNVVAYVTVDRGGQLLQDFRDT